MAGIEITGTIIGGIVGIIGMPTNLTGWLFCYILAGFLFLLMVFILIGVPIIILYNKLIR